MRTVCMWDAEVQLHAFLTHLTEVSGHHHAPTALPPGDWVRLGASRNSFGKKKNHLHFPAFETRTIHPVASG
jgi:hypothetical protein